MARTEIRDIVDPHLHLWQLGAGQYHWLQAGNAPDWPDKAILQKDYTVADLVLAPPFRLAGLVHIEAGFDNHAPARELHWLAQQKIAVPHRAVAFLNCSLPLAQVLANLQELLPFQPGYMRRSCYLSLLS